MIPNPANYSAISFPLLGIEVDPIRTISLGPLTIHLYGAVIALGLLLAEFLLANLVLKRIP